ncbi:MAG TPA: response regulator transcription factor [Sporichthyaceae bacterium]|jgi:two-component system OmpR family response regulator|nr:response regulator transcription factor [Sporichthyaceae bacterium]
MRLLIVARDRKVAAETGSLLRQQGYAVDSVPTEDEALFRVAEFTYDLIVLEKSARGADGIGLCAYLRDRKCWAPILILADDPDPAAAARALDAGADDYLRKPFAAIELLARLRALMRRDSNPRPVMLQAGDLSMDPATRRVCRGGVPIDLSAKEFALLEEFLRHPGDALSRSYLIEHVWDFAYDGASNVVDVYVRYLRDKVDRPFGRASIQTVRAVGYRLDPQG